MRLSHSQTTRKIVKALKGISTSFTNRCSNYICNNNCICYFSQQLHLTPNYHNLTLVLYTPLIKCSITNLIKVDFYLISSQIKAVCSFLLSNNNTCSFTFSQCLYSMYSSTHCIHQRLGNLIRHAAIVIQYHDLRWLINPRVIPKDV